MTNGPTLSSLHIALVGCGKMGGAMLRGWMDSGVGRIDVLEPNDLPVPITANVTHHRDASSFTGAWGMVVIAVKPQVMKDVCEKLSTNLSAATPLLSIAAGQKIAAFQTYFDAAQPVIRTMPNTPAAIGKGMIVACASPQINAQHRIMAEALLHNLGLTLWTNNESDMDAVTAVSGSGPAYVFYLIEVLSEAGMKAGLSADVAATLARQTVIGSAALAEADEKLSAARLRENVTSPGGTTEAALRVLMDGRWQEILTSAIVAATERSKELSK